MRSSPATPAGTGLRSVSTTKSLVLAMGRPMGRQGGPVLGRAGKFVGRDHVGFGRAILVDQGAIGQTGEKLHQGWAYQELLPGGYDLFQGGWKDLCGGGHLGQVLKGHKRQKYSFDGLLFDKLKAVYGIQAHLVRDQDQVAAR